MWYKMIIIPNPSNIGNIILGIEVLLMPTYKKRVPTINM
jgi:hypothetical protein